MAQKVEELKNKIAQETAARDGLMKMKGVYEANPALGDPRSVESKISRFLFEIVNHKLIEYLVNTKEYIS